MPSTDDTEKVRLFAWLSAPLLIGLFVPGLPILSLILVPGLALWLGPEIWPGLSRGWSLLYALGVSILAWLIPVGSTPNLLIPLCQTDWVGTVVPALTAGAAYVAVGVNSVTTQRPKLWFVAGLVIPAVHSVTTYSLIATGLAADYVC